ncbi:ubiquinol-cytochrome C chaperone family protein [Magnetovibrio sp.]|uniref:ubiquinol-cytochrome C chaperone family protein n=1 Tax=Magnetovibrio sp. TaxID=2024836 RepID=UPI002F928731
MKALLKKLGFSRPDPIAVAWYATAVKAARQVEYFTDLGVPDTVDGRFDMISLTAALINRRIGLVDSQHAARIQELAQELFDVMFADMDINLRELGVSDEGMKHRIKPMASAHLGRVKAYTDALSAASAEARLVEFTDVVKRNIYRAVEDDSGAQTLAARMIALSEELDRASDDDILNARFAFSTQAGEGQ